MRRKNIVLMILVFCLLFGLCGCGMREPDGGVTLWVLTEQSASDGMNLQAEIIAQRMEEKYDNLTIQLDILPADAIEREILLKQLRTQIMAGKGPDVYLLPTGNQLMTDFPESGSYRKRMYISIEPLFWDVMQIMRGQLFADISAYYDRDSGLGKEALKPEIMSAGVQNGKRFVLPLRFTMPILMSAPDDWAQNGMSAELLNSSAVSLVDTAVRRGDAAMLTGLQLPEDSSLLPRLFDYESEEVLVSAGEIADYMEAYQAWKAVSVNSSYALLKKCDEKDLAAMREIEGGSAPKEDYRKRNPFHYEFWRFNSISTHICHDMNWRTVGLPLFTCSLADSLETLAIAKQAHFEAAIYPLRASDGSIIASISYYGAVSCSCRQPELAYEFLRQFLTEEFQWDTYRPRNEKKGTLLNWPYEVQTKGQVEGSWPVRADGAFPHLWSNLKYQARGIVYSYRKDSSQVSREIQNVNLTEEDLPALSWPIDEVRFPISLKGEESIEYALSLLNEEDGTPTDADINALAEQVYQNLRYHLAEG